MLALADAVILSEGWKRRLIAMGAGAIGALCLAPIQFAPALVVPMVVAVWLIDGSCATTSGRQMSWPGWGSVRLAFGAGWWLGFGYFLAGLWWLAAAFILDPEFAWALPLGVIGVPALLALFTGTGFVLARLIWVPGPMRILSLALALGIAEFARGHWFSGFPWNAFGMALGNHLVTAQTAALVGLDGLNLLTVGLFAAPATLWDGTDRRLAWKPTLVAFTVFAMSFAYGTIRLSNERPKNVPGIIVRLVQPGVVPNDKFVPENKDQIVAHYIEMSKRDDPKKGVKLDDVSLLVWPESAFPFILTRDPQALATIGAALPPKTVLVTGAARELDVTSDRSSRTTSIYFNALQVIASGGTIVDSYDKVHLVPFGEYLPFNAYLQKLGLRNFVAIPGGFDPGRIRRALAIPGLPSATPLICYEAIFPGSVSLTPGGSARRSGFLLNVTNDGWFGSTAGPSQHFAQARLRTIEEGLPMIRDAATGISAIIDAYGRILEYLPLGSEGIVDGPLPSPIPQPLFARLGPLTVYIVWISTLLVILAGRLVRRRTT